MARRVVVIGGGLAGLSAAVSCADGGAEVLLLEARARLGGLTWSFERDGLTLDNGQHVFLRCCTEYRAFLERLGSAADAPLQERLAIPVIRPGGRTGWIRADRLPAPLHLGRSMASYPHLSPGERLRAATAVLALRRLRLEDPALDRTSFGQWLERHGQTRRATEVLWDLITLPTVNLHAEAASLALAVKVFQTGLLTDAAAGDIGWSHVPLQSLHGDAAAKTLAGLGAEVRLHARVTSIETAGAGVAVVAGGERIVTDAVVLAVPHDVAAGLLPAGALAEPQRLRRLGSSPIVNVHVIYDRKVTDLGISAGLGTAAQFIFDRTESSGLAARTGGAGRRPQCLAVSLSAAEQYQRVKPAEVITAITASLAELFPAAQPARVVDAVVTRERLATFRGAPGSAALRPGAVTKFPNLFLAGAWTDTGWPATMEGAVRSGNEAARRVLGATSPITHPVTLLEEVVA